MCTPYTERRRHGTAALTGGTGGKNPSWPRGNHQGYLYTYRLQNICVPMIVVRFLDVFLLLMANNRNEGRKKERKKERRNAIASAVQCFFIPFFFLPFCKWRGGGARVIYDSRTNAQQPRERERERPCGFARDVKKKKRMCRCISLSLGCCGAVFYSFCPF